MDESTVTHLSFESLHRKIVVVGAAVSMVLAGILIVAPMIGDFGPGGTRLIASFLGRPVPMHLQRVFVMLMGIVWLVEAVLLFDLSVVGWWMAMVGTAAEVVNALMTLQTAWIEGLINLAVFLYLFRVRSLFFKAPPAST